MVFGLLFHFAYKNFAYGGKINIENTQFWNWWIFSDSLVSEQTLCSINLSRWIRINCRSPCGVKIFNPPPSPLRTKFQFQMEGPSFDNDIGGNGSKKSSTLLDPHQVIFIYILCLSVPLWLINCYYTRQSGPKLLRQLT